MVFSILETTTEDKVVSGKIVTGKIVTGVRLK